MRILLIEDDEVLTNVLLESLTSQHYLVDTASDGKLGWEYAQGTPYDLILMDVGLPKLDGITLCQQLRSSGCSAPILLITAKDASSDRIRGLDAGADDYLIKPLDLAELQARVRALLRRGDVSRSPVLEVGELKLDPSSCQVTFKGKLLPLTPKEYNLLELFLRNPSRVFSRGNIIEHLWTFDDPPQEESVKAHIKGLRQKLRSAGAGNWIENVYGLGYRLNPQEAGEQGSGGAGEQGSRGAGEQRSTGGTPVRAAENFRHPTPSVEQQFDRKMEEMWQQYQGLMAKRLEVLQRTSAALETGSLSHELRSCAGREAHKLAGVLGMFERETGTLISKEIEEILLEEGELLPEQQKKVRSLIQELSNQLNLSPQTTDKGKAEESSKFSVLSSQLEDSTQNSKFKTQNSKLKTQNSSTHSPTPLSDARLLLIDLNRKLGTALQQLAQSAGTSWEQVATLKEAKIWVQERSPDLVVLSVMESDRESLALLTDLAKRTPSVPVIVLAAADGLIDRVTVARSGGRGFLVKPVTANQIWDLGSQLLQRTRSMTVNLLVVDDDPVFLGALRPMLEPWGMRITGLDDPLRFWEVLKVVSPDLLILDVEMPQISGIELCQAVRTDPNWQELPILFLTAHRDLETIQQVFAAGADDYLVKPVVAVELLTRITNRLERTRLLRTLSTKDPLTGLANQPLSSRDLENSIQQAEGKGYSICLAIFSLPQLRQINIEYGHSTGNQVLQKWGSLFESAFGGAEVLGYWGNGEFVVGMPGLTKEIANDRMADILTSLRQQVFTAPDGNRFQVTCSFAIAEYPTDGLTLQSLYQAASKTF